MTPLFNTNRQPISVRVFGDSSKENPRKILLSSVNYCPPSVCTALRVEGRQCEERSAFPSCALNTKKLKSTLPPTMLSLSGSLQSPLLARSHALYKFGLFVLLSGGFRRILVCAEELASRITAFCQLCFLYVMDTSLWIAAVFPDRLQLFSRPDH